MFKYIFVQLFISFKNLFFSSKTIKIKSKKTLFIKLINDNLISSELDLDGYTNYLIASQCSKTKFTEDLSSKSFSFSTIRIPDSNAEVLFFKNYTFSVGILPGTKCNYLSISLFDFISHLNQNIRYFINHQYYFNSLIFFKGRVLLEKRKKVDSPQARKYIPYTFTRIGFLEKIYKENVNSVVLRGFESLNRIESFVEDIDMLIDEKDIKTFDAILNDTIGVFPIDLYSDSGEVKTSFSGLPYYPQRLAKKILKTKEVYDFKFYVPNKKFYLLSYIYHIVFHKSLKSGFPINHEIQNLLNSKKNYQKITKDAFLKNDIKIEYSTLESLSIYLKNNDFFPEYDLILKLEQLKKDNWYRFLVKSNQKNIEKEYFKIKGISVFLLREEACAPVLIELVEKRIEDFGFFLIEKINIPDELADDVNSSIRGGKWDIGPYELNAGFPKLCYVLYDPFFVEPLGEFKKQYPHLENKKATQVKIVLRDEINKIVPKSINSIHSSDDFYEAVYYLNKITNSHLKTNEIIDKCNIICNNHKSPDTVLKDYSRFAVRARVELISFKGNNVIKKRYKKNKLVYLMNELWFLKQFKHSSVIPKLIAHDDSSLIIEYFKNSKNLNETYLKTKHILQLQTFFKDIYDNKITLLDVNPSNVLIDENDNIKVIDFEYAQSYKNAPEQMQHMYELSSFSLNDVGVYPSGHEKIKNAYNKFWHEKTCLTLNQFLFVKNRNLIFFLRFVNTIPIFGLVFLKKIKGKANKYKHKILVEVNK